MPVRGLASGIARRPNSVARALESTRHGILWLLYHLKGLAEVLKTKGAWTTPSASCCLTFSACPWGIATASAACRRAMTGRSWRP